MAIIKNAILLPIQRLIGIAPASQETVVDTSSVSLTFPIVPDIARRSLSSQPTGGWFQGVLENVHSSADDELSSIDPYLAAADAVPPYPTAISNDFDVWILSIALRRSSGSGGLTGALISINPGPFQQCWGRDDSGAPVVATPPINLAFFDSINEDTAVSTDPGVTVAGDTIVHANMRIARGTTILFNSTSAAAAEFQALFIIGLFPAGLGQDVVT